MPTSSHTKLFTKSGCVQSLILRFAAEVKRMDYILLDVDSHPALAARLGITQAPALSDNYVTTGEIDILLEYMDEQHPSPALLPPNVATRAVYRKQARSFHRDLFPLLAPAKAGDKQALNALVAYLHQMNEITQGFKYFASNELSIMDVTVGPWLWTAKASGLCLKQFKYLSCYADRLFALPAFQACLRPAIDAEAA